MRIVLLLAVLALSCFIGHANKPRFDLFGAYKYMHNIRNELTQVKIDASTLDTRRHLSTVKLLHKIRPLFDTMDVVRNHTRQTRLMLFNNSYMNVQHVNMLLRLGNILHEIDRNVDTFLDYSAVGTTFELFTIVDFAKSLAAHDSQSSLIDNLQLLIDGADVHATHLQTSSSPLGVPLFRMLVNALPANDTYSCKWSVTPQQLTFAAYLTVYLAHTYSYSLLQVAYLILSLNDLGNFHTEIQRADENYLRIMQKLDFQMSLVSGIPDNRFRTCDPVTHVPDVTYTELQGFLQGFIVNEVDLNVGKSCSSTCGYYKHSTVKHCFQNSDRDYMLCNIQQRCPGQIHSCQYIKSDFDICFANQTSYIDPLYNWIEFEDYELYGKKMKNCYSKRKIDSWWRGLALHCSYCFCTCESTFGYSHKYFSLLEHHTQVEHNMFATGARFVKIDGVIYIQLQQAKINKFGLVDGASVGWAPLTNRIKPMHNTYGYKEGRDYAKLSWVQRAIDLDTLVAPAGHVLTGVRFRLLGHHLNLEIKVTQLKSINELGNSAHSFWVSNDATTHEHSRPIRTKITRRSDLHSALTNTEQSRMDSRKNKFVEFQMSSWKHDVGRHTIPFIDTQTVSTNPASPISALRIYLRGTHTHSGFIGLQIQTLETFKLL